MLVQICTFSANIFNYNFLDNLNYICDQKMYCIYFLANDLSASENNVISYNTIHL